MPARWAMSWRTVTLLASWRARTYVEAGASRSTLPCSARSISSAAVKVTVTPPSAMPEVGTSAVPAPSTPAAPLQTPCGVTTAAVTPGRSPLSIQRCISRCIDAAVAVGRRVVGGAGQDSAPGPRVVPAGLVPDPARAVPAGLVAGPAPTGRSCETGVALHPAPTLTVRRTPTTRPLRPARLPSDRAGGPVQPAGILDTVEASSPALRVTSRTAPPRYR